MDLCAVVLEQDVPVDARKYGEIVAPILGVTRLEAKIIVRKGRGLFLEDLREEDAQRMVDELSRDGIRARRVRNEDLPVLGAPRKVTLVERAEGTLRYRWAGEERWTDIPWAQLDVVSLGAVAMPGFRDLFSNVRFDYVPALHKLQGEPGVRDLLRENLILKMSAPSPREAAPRRKPSESGTLFDELQSKYGLKLKVYADLVDSTHTLWLRVPMDEMAYAPDAHSVKLGEAWGFHLLVHDLHAFAGPAFTAVSLRFVPGADIKDLVFQQLEDLNRYTTWHAVLRHLGIKPCSTADSSSPSPEPPAPSTDGGSSSASPAPVPPSTSS